ncbi:MAG: ArnT family glycosyltransferase [Phycisphaerae bacterium]
MNPTADPQPAAHSIQPVKQRGRRYRWIACVLLLVVAFKLASTGLTWGLPAVVAWAPDTVAGSRTLFTYDKWPDAWVSHYPPLHFLLNRLIYRPWLDRWQTTGQMRWDDATGEPVFAPPVEDKYGALILASRCLTVLMSLATVCLVVLLTRRLFDGNDLAGLLAGLTLATCPEWVYFSHLGNLDVPQIFWLALSLVSYVAALQHDTLRHHVLLGVATALAVSTKDGVAGVYVGVVLVLMAARYARRRRAGASVGRSLAALVSSPMLLGLVGFAIPYALIQGLWINPTGYIDRMRYWLGGPGISNFNRDYQGQFWLAREALAEAARGLGWPMLGVMAVATVYTLRRDPRTSAIVIVPAVSYYLVVPAAIGMVYARMLFPVFLCLAVLVGKTLADWLTWQRIPLALRGASVLALFALSGGYCWAVDREMLDDTRARAESWLIQNTTPDRPLGVFAPPQYLPRFSPTTLQAVLLEMAPATFARNCPSFLVLSSHNYQDFDAKARHCLERLLAGEFGYQVVARFQKRFLPPQRHWWSLAGWATRGAGKVSPFITILKRNEPPPP